MIWKKKTGIRMDRDSHQVSLMLEKKIGNRMNRKGLLILLLKREAVLGKTRLQGEDKVVKWDQGMYIVSTH
jgi:hypothetical protein